MTPTELVLTVAGTVVALAAGAAAVYKAAWSRGFKAAERSLNDTALRKRFERLYAPMAALFLVSHIASYQSSRAPYLSQRFKRAWTYLTRGKPIKAAAAIDDRLTTRESAEVEYGPSFPLEDIQRILAGNEAYADDRLLVLIADADRSRYETALQRSHNNSDLTDEEFKLFKHIVAVRSKLGAVFSSNT